MKCHLYKGFKLSQMTLGTVQLGLNYGIANKAGKPSRDAACRILKAATSGGVRVFDTASAYGDSEAIIGSFLQAQRPDDLEVGATVVTKLPEFYVDNRVLETNLYETAKRYLYESADRLRLRKIPICLLHGGTGIDAHHGRLVQDFARLRDEGHVELIGASVDDAHEIESFLRVGVFDVIQLPVNIFDQEVVHNGLLHELGKKNVAVFARSLFLQGLFFLSPNNLPRHLQCGREPLERLRQISQSCQIPVPELALTYVRDLPHISSVVLGVESVTQLRENLRLMDAPPIPDRVRDELSEAFRRLPEKLIRPTFWQQRQRD